MHRRRTITNYHRAIQHDHCVKEESKQRASPNHSKSARPDCARAGAQQSRRPLAMRMLTRVCNRAKRVLFVRFKPAPLLLQCTQRNRQRISRRPEIRHRQFRIRTESSGQRIIVYLRQYRPREVALRQRQFAACEQCRARNQQRIARRLRGENRRRDADIMLLPRFPLLPLPSTLSLPESTELSLPLFARLSPLLPWFALLPSPLSHSAGVAIRMSASSELTCAASCSAKPSAISR